MKKIYSILVVLSISLMLSLSTFAQEPGTKTPVVRKHQVNQQKRIHQGVRSGELTRKETRKLEKEQHEINQDKREAKSDGTVTTEERKEIKQDQNQANRHIYRAKHNRRDRN